MKKIFIFLNVIALGALVASCNLNTDPVFDDANAFVELGKASVTVAEDGGSISIPVTLASLNGVEEMVSYETVDGTAKAGIDFALADPTATLTFDAENRTQNIVINIINRAGEYTGDLSFEVKLAATGSLSAGMVTSCKVMITDNDHPLAAILGTYTCESLNYGKAPQSWETQILKDPDDVTVVHITAITPGCAAYPSWGDWSYSGTVSEDKKTITFAAGQECEAWYQTESDTFALLTWADGIYLYDDEDIVFTYDDATGTWSTPSNIWLYPVETESLYTNWCVRGPMTMTKK